MMAWLVCAICLTTASAQDLFLARADTLPKGAFVESPPAERTNRSSFSGTWLQHGPSDKLTGSQYGFLLGVDIWADWKDIEPEDGHFDFSDMESKCASALAAGFRIQTALRTGSYAPHWVLAKASVQVRMSSGHSCAHLSTQDPSDLREEIATVGGHSDGTCTWPDYLDPFYQERFLRAVEKFAEWIASSKFKHAIVSSQAMFGTTGDDGPYHGKPVDPKKTISRQQWENFTLSLAPAVCKSYTSRGIDPLWNSDDFPKFLALCPGSDLKTGQVSHGFQVTGEADNYVEKAKYCHTKGYHCRGESWAFSQHGDYKEAPLWATYAHNNWLLTFGLDLPGFSSNTLEDPQFAPLYRLFNLFATSIRPPADNWIGAIIQLRDGLDSANKERFPESKYGTASQNNGDRMKRIVSDFAHRGAGIGDIAAATGSAMKSRTPSKMNDVGWRIWEGNYGNGLLTQLAPLETSVGLWRVGPKDQWYGRFARQFNTAMGFVLDTKLWSGLPMSGAKARPLMLSVVYFDGAPPSVNNVAERTLVIAYDGQKGCTSATISLGNTNRWKTWKKTIVDGKFGKGCSGTKTNADGADIMLRSISGGEIAISTLQIYDPNGKF